MRRRRFQRGSVRTRKHGPHKVWVAQWWDNGNKRSRVLGRCSGLQRGEAEAIMAQILQPLNGDAGLHSAPVFTFAQYVQDVFLPAYRQKWKESTRSTSEPDIVRYLIPALGTQRLDKITREQMQSFLEQLGKRLTASVVGHARWGISTPFFGWRKATARFPSIRPTRCSYPNAKRLAKRALCLGMKFVQR